MTIQRINMKRLDNGDVEVFVEGYGETGELVIPAEHWITDPSSLTSYSYTEGTLYGSGDQDHTTG